MVPEQSERFKSAASKECVYAHISSFNPAENRRNKNKCAVRQNSHKGKCTHIEKSQRNSALPDFPTLIKEKNCKRGEKKI